MPEDADGLDSRNARRAPAAGPARRLTHAGIQPTRSGSFRLIWVRLALDYRTGRCIGAPQRLPRLGAPMKAGVGSRRANGSHRLP
jgi:hypothetical protein